VYHSDKKVQSEGISAQDGEEDFGPKIDEVIKETKAGPSVRAV
jgi:hypothetical protein